MSARLATRQQSSNSIHSVNSNSTTRTDKMGDGGSNGPTFGHQVDRQRSGSDSSGGILANAHEAPKRSARADTGFRSALKAAFVPQQPGKQIKTNGKPLGKTFRRAEPLPQKHEGGEVLKIDPRGPNAPCGDGIVLNSLTIDDESESSGEESPNEATKAGQSTDRLSVPSQSSGTRSRSETGSTSVSEDSPSSSKGSLCAIKFAPLPTSGRLKRANSITIGVAARSQLLHSQGAGRQTGNGTSQQWQQQYQQQRQQQRNQEQQSQSQEINASRYSGIQSQESAVDLGDELRKGALKAWDRVRRGSNTSRSSGSRDRSTSNPSTQSTVAEEEEEGHEAGEEGEGDKTPKRAQSPTHLARTTPDKEGGEEGTQTPRSRRMPRRVSTGAFTGHASFLEMEEKRKRGDFSAAAMEGDRIRDHERENEATKFIEMLGSTGAGKEAFHGADGGRRKADGRGKVVDVGSVGPEFSVGSEAEQGDEEEDDDDETREAEQLADDALKHHSDKLTKAAGKERYERKKS